MTSSPYWSLGTYCGIMVSLTVVLATVFVLVHIHLTEKGVREGLQQLLNFWSDLAYKKTHHYYITFIENLARWWFQTCLYVHPKNWGK